MYLYMYHVYTSYTRASTEFFFISGADINIVDNFGLNALDIAEKFGHKTCARALFMYRWQQRAKNVRPSAKVPLFAHQLFDSSLATHMRGPFQQMYMECIQPGGEFAGSGFGAKKRVASRREVEFETDSEMSFSSGGSARKSSSVLCLFFVFFSSAFRTLLVCLSSIFRLFSSVPLVGVFVSFFFCLNFVKNIVFNIFRLSIFRRLAI